MPGSGAGFFRGIDGERLADRVFEVAYFWRLDPAAVMALSLSNFVLYEDQAACVAAKLNRSNDGR
jgi:hypothetical protein